MLTNFFIKHFLIKLRNGFYLGIFFILFPLYAQGNTVLQGNWAISEWEDSTDCGEDTYTINFNAFITVTNDIVNVQTDEHNWQGPLVNNSVRYSLTYPEDGGQTTVNGNLTFNGETINGGTQWVWRGTGFSCRGNSVITGTWLDDGGTGTTTNTGPENVTVQDNPGIMDVDQSQSRGTTYYATPLSVGLADAQLSPAGIVLTQLDSKISIQDEGMAKVTLKSQTLASFQPIKTDTTTDLSSDTIVLHRGAADIAAKQSSNEYQAITPTAKIVIAADDVDIQSGLMAYYPFNGNANDESGHNHHATLQSPLITSDKNGLPDSAYAFNGHNDTIMLPEINQLLANNTLSLSIWVYADNNNKGTIISNNYQELPAITITRLNSGLIQFKIKTTEGDGYLNALTIPQQHWTHIGLSYDGQTVKAYINGELVNNQPLSGQISNANPFILGNDSLAASTDSYWHGKMDELRLYKRVLSHLAFRQLYKNTAMNTRSVRNNLPQTHVSVSYNQQGLNGTTHVSVSSGNIEVQDREGNWQTLGAGEERALSALVSRTSWVMPIDGGVLYGGKTNTLIWLSYPEAQAYALEFNLPQPIFSENNAETPENTQQVIPFFASFYTNYEDLTIATLAIPDVPGLKVETRLFALDGQGNILSQSVSSDKASFVFE